MHVPLDITPHVQPDQPPDVSVRLNGVGAGAQAIAEGVNRAAQGIDTLASDVEREQARMNHVAAVNAATQFDFDAQAFGDGKVPDPSRVGNGQTNSTAQAAGDAAFDEAKAPHELPSGPSTQATSMLSDPTTGLPSGGYYNTKGMDASKSTDAYMRALAQRQSDIASGLSNETQKQLFTEYTNKKLLAFRGEAISHAERERQKAVEATTEANVTASFSAINSSVDRADNAQQALKSADALTQGPSDALRGLAITPEAGSAKVSAYQQEVYSGVAEHFITKKDAASAQAVLDAKKAELSFGKDGERHFDQLQQAVNRLRNTNDAQGAAQKIIDGAQTEDGLHDMGKVGAAVLALPPEQRTQALFQAVHELQGYAQEQDRASTGNDWKTALSQYQQGPAGANRMENIDPTVLNRMQQRDPDRYEKLLELVRRDSKHSGKRGAQPSTPEQDSAYLKLRVDMADHPEKYQGMDVDDFKNSAQPFTSPKDWKKLEGAFVEIRGKKSPSDTTLPAFAQTIVLEDLRSAGAIPTKGSPQQLTGQHAQTYQQAEDEVMGKITAYKAAHKGATPPAEVVQGYSRDATIKMEVGGTGFFGSNVRNDSVTQAEFLSNPKYSGKALVPPKDAAEGIRQRILQSGRPEPTPEQIQQVYTSMVRSGKALPSAEPAQPAAARSPEHLTNPVVREAITGQPSAPGLWGRVKGLFGSSDAPAPTAPASDDRPDFSPSTGAKLVPPPAKPKSKARHAATRSAPKATAQQALDDAEASATSGTSDISGALNGAQ